MTNTTKQNLTFKIQCAGDVWITVSEFEYLMALLRGEKVRVLEGDKILNEYN
jgi:hypothetical protein